MRPIRIAFSDYWPGHRPTQDPIYGLLRKHFPLAISSEPDILFFSCFGVRHLSYRCHKIHYIGENIRPDFRIADRTLSFDYNNDHRNLRWPNYLMYLQGFDVSQLARRKDNRVVDEIVRDKNRFCALVVSNPIAQERLEFFRLLSKYKHVDSAGSVLNNVGGPVANKHAFLRPYKFTIAFEHSSHPGYTTEKLVQAAQAFSVPIYWGNPRIADEFNSRSFINCHEFGSLRELAERVIEVDNDEALYRNFLREAPLPGREGTLGSNASRLVAFFGDLVQSLDHAPVSRSLAFRAAVPSVIYREVVRRAPTRLKTAQARVSWRLSN